MDEGVRIDKWLWAARFFKTRALAKQAVARGKVQLDGQRIKPGKTLNPGDRLHIARGEEVFEITVESLGGRRGPASEAREMFSESEASVQRREAAAEQRKIELASRSCPAGRPDKRERRRIIDFSRGRR